MNFKYLSIFIVAALLVVYYAVNASQPTDTNFAAAKEMIIMRKIGHEVLLHSGDSASRVLPVKKVAENEYQILFASQFTFNPDSLIDIVNRTLKTSQLPSDYIVNVKDCASNEMVFGYAMSATKQKNIIACKGRQQAMGCYSINISFQNDKLLGLPVKYAAAGIGLVALVAAFAGVKIYNKKKPVSAEAVLGMEENFIPIGKYHFYNDKQYLTINNEQIKLTQKESKLLHIFAAAPNEIIDRNGLQKEIWEDEGVIVGRSLDMFISKLRKKLEHDSTVKVVNIHGRGYKLEIES